jgi:hypothetical protein
MDSWHARETKQMHTKFCLDNLKTDHFKDLRLHDRDILIRILKEICKQDVDWIQQHAPVNMVMKFRLHNMYGTSTAWQIPAL